MERHLMPIRKDTRNLAVIVIAIGLFASFLLALATVRLKTESLRCSNLTELAMYCETTEAELADLVPPSAQEYEIVFYRYHGAGRIRFAIDEEVFREWLQLREHRVWKRNQPETISVPRDGQLIGETWNQTESIDPQLSVVVRVFNRRINPQRLVYSREQQRGVIEFFPWRPTTR
jgi:hypothetical protein